MKTSKILELLLTAALGVGMVGTAAPAVALTAGSLTVKVTTPSGFPLEGFDVSATGPSTGSGTTNSAGIVTLSSLNSGNYELSAYGEVASTWMTLIGQASVTGATSNATIKIPGNEVSGTITLNGTPVKDSTVTLEGKNSREPGGTDDHGRFFFFGVSNDSYTVIAENENRGVSTTGAFGGLVTYLGNTVRGPEATRFAVTPATLKTGLSISMVQAATVTGQVVSKAGKGLSGVAVIALNKTRAGDGYVVTDSKGNFKISGLATGPVDLYASTTKRTARKTVSVTQGKTVSAGKLTLKPGAATGKIKGTLINKAGSNVYASVTFIPVKKGGLPVSGWLAYGKKTYSISSVAVGKYKVVVSGTNKSAGTITVKKGKTTKVKKLTRVKGTTISGVVKGSNGKPLARQYVDVEDSLGTTLDRVTTDSRGRYVAEGAVSGKYTVSLHGIASNLPKAVKVNLKKGKPAKVNLRLKKGVAVKGVVRNTSGKTIAEMHVRVWTDQGLSGFKFTPASGKFSLKGIGRGKVTVIARDPFVGGYVDKAVKIKAPNSAVKITVKTR